MFRGRKATRLLVDRATWTGGDRVKLRYRRVRLKEAVANQSASLWSLEHCITTTITQQLRTTLQRISPLAAMWANSTNLLIGIVYPAAGRVVQADWVACIFSFC
jgi:hypothetical protein